MSSFAKGRIYDVLRKPTKCPKCGNEVWPIIYGTGEMTEAEFLFKYRKQGNMGGDNIPRRPPVWECSCCNARFRKVNEDGTDAPGKVRLLKNERVGKIKFSVTGDDGITREL